MRNQLAAILTIVFVCLASQIAAQNNAMYQLEKVSVADFNPKSPVIDASANAVVLAEIGSSEFVSNPISWYSLVFKYTKRLLIKNKNAFDEATVKIPVYVGDNREDVENIEFLEASTYNLNANNTIEETKLDKTEIYNTATSKVKMVKKFTFPKLKEGSIIQYSYTLKSNFFILIRPWIFQNQYPTLISQYHVIIPPMFNYFTLRQGYLPYSADSSRALFNAYSTLISNTANADSYFYSVKGNARFTLWSLKEVPAFKDETLSGDIKSLLPKIYFQLNSINFSDKKLPRTFLRSWINTVKVMLDDEDYYSVLKDKNNWLDGDCKKLLGNTKIDKAKLIYNYVRDSYKCIDYDATVWLSEPIKKIYQSKTGSVTDINLMLMAMLSHEGFDVRPVMLSTKDNGRVTEQAPILHQYNYVIARLKIDTTYYLLDASEPKLGFGKLDPNCYNGSGRVLDDSATLISLTTNDITEQKSTVVFISNDDSDKVTGIYNATLGYGESTDIRTNFKEKTEENYQKALVKSIASDITIANVKMDSLNTYEAPIGLHYDILLNLNDADVIYFNPILSDAINKNPFSAAERVFPIEMPNKTNDVYTLNMEVPKGYKIDDIPKSARVKLNNDEGMYEYIVAVSGNDIQLRSKLIINKATFPAEDYQTLRDFYAFVVKKQAEQIVFKKIK